MTDTRQTNAGASSQKTKRGRKWLPAIARILLGLAFLVFGLNGFLNFIPTPKTLPEEIVTVMGALMKAGYIKVVSGAEVLAAVMLLTNCFVPLALTLLAPIIVGILTFHISMARETIGPGLIVLAIELYLACAYRGAFRPMLAFKTSPGANRV